MGAQAQTDDAVVDRREGAPSKALDAGVLGGSEGCGRAGGAGGRFDTRTKRIGGQDRRYHVRLPDGYDPGRPYPLVFRWHGYGGNGLSGGLDIEYAAGGDAIIVAADGLNAHWTSASQEGDLLLFDAMLEEVAQQYCVDLDRVFAYGFSAGGGLTNALGCKRADKLRAIAAIAGFDRADASCEGKPIAAWFQHDEGDPAVPIAQGRAARDRVLRRNGCSSSVTLGGGCEQYADCERGDPVVWCETRDRGHDIAGSTAPHAVWRFFSSLPPQPR